MSQFATIELFKEYLKFSAAHFTVFSESERERLHGHNFSVTASLRAPIDQNGLCFSYGLFKKKLEDLCQLLDEYLLLPGLSPFLIISEQENCYLVRFNREEMLFLKSDTRILPLRNISVEELAGYLLEQLVKDTDVDKYQINQIELSVSSGPGQRGIRRWQSASHSQ